MSKELYNYIMKGCVGSKIKREQGGKSFWQTGMCGRGTTVKVGCGHVQQIQKASSLSFKSETLPPLLLCHQAYCCHWQHLRLKIFVLRFPILKCCVSTAMALD